MRYVSRLTGEPIKFKNREAYNDHLKELRDKGLLKRERSRKTRPDTARDDEWKEAHSPLTAPATRFSREEVPEPKGHVRQKITLIHPSRSRPSAARQCIYMWADYMSPYNELEYILSLDVKDADKYRKVFIELMGQMGMRACIGANRNVVDAMNRAANLATGDILIYVSDDFESFSNWDLALQEAVTGDDWFLMVDDGIQKNVATLLIVSRKYYRRFGYLYYPEYKSMWGDNDATEVAKCLGKYQEAFHLLFKHNHHSIGGIGADGTTARHENSETWSHGENLFREREARGFDI